MEIHNVPISEVWPSPMNPRKTFEEDSILELADNIAAQGLLQPITVRPIECSGVAGVYTLADHGIRYEIVCGERRYRAVKKLHERDPKKWATIALIVRQMDDAQAFDAMITENLQRKDVDPMEEAFAFAQLIERGDSPEEVALRFGKSIRFVQDRVKLNNLIPNLSKRIKEGTMAIAAGLVLSKLEKSEQERAYNQLHGYGTITKAQADGFVSRLFMRLDRSAWYMSANDADKDFEGSCGTSCAKCRLNTANAECLFWEMKADAEDAKCTCRDRFLEKHLDYVCAFLESQGDKIVKKGEALEYGKTVVIDTAYCWSDETRRVHDLTIERLTERGYEVVNPKEVFGSRVYYSADDSRIPKMLADGEIYRCVDVLSHDSAPTPTITHYYIKRKANDDNTPKGEVAPTEVISLVGKHKRNIEMVEVFKAKKLAEKASEMRVSDEDQSQLCEEEQLALDAFVIQAAPSKDYWERYGIDGTHYYLTSEDAYKIASEYSQDRNRWYREYLRQRFAKATTPDMLDSKLCRIVMEVWDAESVTSIDEESAKTLAKKQKNIISRLSDLGYDVQGRKLQK